MEKNKKIGLIIIGGCAALLIGVLLSLTRNNPEDEATEGNVYPDVAEGNSTPVKDSKYEAYMTENSDNRVSNTK